MSRTKSDTTKASESPAKGTPSTGTTQGESTQAIFDREQKQGFRGIETDPTPNENYTVAGVTSGAPTPETDAGLAKNVRQATGMGLSALEAAAREKGGSK